MAHVVTERSVSAPDSLQVEAKPGADVETVVGQVELHATVHSGSVFWVAWAAVEWNAGLAYVGLGGIAEDEVCHAKQPPLLDVGQDAGVHGISGECAADGIRRLGW